MKLPIDYARAHWMTRIDARNQYIDEQEGMCMYCKESLDEDPPSSITDKKIDWSLFPSSFLKYPVHLQHNHSSGMTEGAIHAYCNAVLWQYDGR